MAPVPWATAEQQAFLAKNCDAFIEAQKKKTIHKFWVAVNLDWFEKWPEPGTERLNFPDITEEEQNELGTKIDERKKKIKQWFNNHGTKTRKSTKPFVLNIGAKNHRRLQLVEFYSQKVYDAKIKAKVEREIVKNKIPPKDRLAFARRITRETYEDEPEEYKQALLAEFDLVQPRVPKKNEEGESPVTAKSMAESIESLTSMLDQIYDELTLRTGWTFTVLAGGPDPINGGRIATFAYHRGKNTLGFTFGRAHPTFDKTFLKPFADYLKGVYPSSVRVARALDGPELDVTGVDSDVEQDANSDEGGDDDDDNALPTTAPSLPELPSDPSTSNSSPPPPSLLPADFVLPAGFVFPVPVANAAPKEPRKKPGKKAKKATRTTTLKPKPTTAGAAAKKAAMSLDVNEKEMTDAEADPALPKELTVGDGAGPMPMDVNEKETTGADADPALPKEPAVGDVNEKETTSADADSALPTKPTVGDGSVNDREKEMGGDANQLTLGHRSVDEQDNINTGRNADPVLPSEPTAENNGNVNEGERADSATNPVLPMEPTTDNGMDRNADMDVDAAPHGESARGIRKTTARKTTARNASPDAADADSSLPHGNGRRVRKPTASKEIVSLVDKRRALEALSNPKKKKSKVA